MKSPDAHIAASTYMPGSVPFSDIAEGECFVFLREHIATPENWYTKIGRGYRTKANGTIWRTGYRAAVYRVPNT
jgi:hypothetical protein